MNGGGGKLTASALSPEGVTSSETSETQSVTDEPITARPAVKIIKVKPTKEVEKERPPWRSTAVAKVDSNTRSMIRAKLLDASRRALISHRLKAFSVSTQTNLLPTKLCRDAETDTQIDLILMRDKAVETDGSVTIKSESPGGFILTQTVGQMTDGICQNNCGTQTAQPRTNLSFIRYLPAELNPADDQDAEAMSQTNVPDDTVQLPDLDDIINKNAKILQAQIKDIHKINTELNSKQEKMNLAAETEDSTTPDSNQNAEKDSNEPNQSIYNRLYGADTRRTRQTRPQRRSISANGRRRTLLDEPTLTSWDDFDSTDDDYDDLPPLPRRYMSDGRSPLLDFHDLVIGKRLANMHLAPLPPRTTSSVKRKSVTWSDSQHQAVAELIHEATALMDVFDQVSLLLGPQIQLNTPTKLVKIPRPPPPKWDPILTKTYEELDKELQKFKPHRFQDDICRHLDDD